MGMLWETEVDTECCALQVLHGLEALLGGGRGMMLMDDLARHSPESYEQVMNEAHKILYSLAPARRANRCELFADLLTWGTILRASQAGKRFGNANPHNHS